MVAIGGIPTYGMSGFFKAFSTTTHNELWRVTLAPENGGYLVIDSRPRFTPAGQTLYVTAEILGGDQNNLYGYVYAIDTGSTVSPTPTPVATNTPSVNTPVPPNRPIHLVPSHRPIRRSSSTHQPISLHPAQVPVFSQPPRVPPRHPAPEITTVIRPLPRMLMPMTQPSQPIPIAARTKAHPVQITARISTITTITISTSLRPP
jgi:hypothetical protein